jgi:hypothetical protein
MEALEICAQMGAIDYVVTLDDLLYVLYHILYFIRS